MFHEHLYYHFSIGITVSIVSNRTIFSLWYVLKHQGSNVKKYSESKLTLRPTKSESLTIISHYQKLQWRGNVISMKCSPLAAPEDNIAEQFLVMTFRKRTILHHLEQSFHAKSQMLALDINCEGMLCFISSMWWFSCTIPTGPCTWQGHQMEIFLRY